MYIQVELVVLLGTRVISKRTSMGGGGGGGGPPVPKLMSLQTTCGPSPRTDLATMRARSVGKKSLNDLHVHEIVMIASIS